MNSKILLTETENLALHAEIADLLVRLEALGAGGVGTMLPRHAQPAPVVVGPSPTSGMNIAQRILHVGGRNPQGSTYIEFGSIQAVEALVRQVLRDARPQQIAEPASKASTQFWPCGGCGEKDGNKRCLGCMHPFTTPKEPS